MYKLDTSKWYLERIVYLIAGCMVLLSLALSFAVSQWFLILALLVGINLTVFAATGFCPMAILLSKLGVKSRQ